MSGARAPQCWDSGVRVSRAQKQTAHVRDVAQRDPDVALTLEVNDLESADAGQEVCKLPVRRVRDGVDERER